LCPHFNKSISPLFLTVFTSKTILALALAVGSASAVHYTPSESSQLYLWKAFKAEHQKAYADVAEDKRRFGVFVQNLKLIDARNAAETGTAVHGITKFCDVSVEEFKASHLNYVPSENNVTRTPAVGLPKPVQGALLVQDWAGVYTTPVKDQGYCGSCWAFSVTEQIESDWLREGNSQYILSPQQVSSCTKYWIPGVGGCAGGKPETGYKYAEDGIEQDIDYPYTSGAAGVTGTCTADKSKFVVKTTSYTNVASGQAGDEDVMAGYVESTGPLSIVVDASAWSTYTGGILANCGQDLDHAVQVVGINTDEGSWKVRNSWGTSWGESGYIRLAYGANTCGITADANWCAAEAV